jgi:AcrR family transcriptional regulator
MEIKDRIITGARQMFVKYGIRSITMDMIAEHLGVSKRTIYENFKDKDELLNSCINAAMLDHRARNDKIILSSSNIIEATFRFIENSITIIKSINPAFFYDIRKYYPGIWSSKIKENDARNLNRTIELLNKGIDENLFREDINVEIIAKLILEQFSLLSNRDIFPENEYSMIVVFENIVINFIRGIATEEGLKMINKYNK